MFAVHCHVHESEVLLDWSRVEGLRQTDDGPVIDWRCWCGARGSLIAGGRSEPRDLEAVVIDLVALDRESGRDRDRTSDATPPPAGIAG
jgi:hypothetical protein